MNGNRENDDDENQTDTSYRWLQNPPNFSMINLEVPDFEYTMQQYQKQVLDLGIRLMGLIGHALELPDPEILKKTCEGKAVCHHRILHYPPLTDYHKEVSIGAHVDYGFLTILQQDQVGGLQVLN